MKKREFYFEQINTLLEHYTPINVRICQNQTINVCQESNVIPEINVNGYPIDVTPHTLYFIIHKKNYRLTLDEYWLTFEYNNKSEFKVLLELTSEEHAILMLQFHTAYRNYLKMVHEDIMVPIPDEYRTLESQLMEGCTPDERE